VRKPRPEWSVLIGDCIYGYRSALDHLAFQLAVANSPGKLPSKKIAENSAFPIFNSGPKFHATNRKGVPTTASGLGKISGVSADARAIIERLQPYHRRQNPGAKALWQLYELSNIDKHRLLHVTYSSLSGSRFRLSSTEPIRFHGYEFVPGRLKRGAVIARWNVSGLPDHPIDMDVDAELVTDVTFDHASPARSVRDQSVMQTLHAIGCFIAFDVLPPLSAELGLSTAFKPSRLINALSGYSV